jgi:Rps23 Pro-64 3,4-dihydroxylase Tpa1-like proline 4-hydroxylase
MDDEGLTAVYNFTAGFGARDGGELYFPWRGRIELIQPPRFNSLILFRPKGAPHGVKRVRGRGTRFTVTAFFTAAGERPPMAR